LFNITISSTVELVEQQARRAAFVKLGRGLLEQRVNRQMEIAVERLKLERLGVALESHYRSCRLLSLNSVRSSSACCCQKKTKKNTYAFLLLDLFGIVVVAAVLCTAITVIVCFPILRTNKTKSTCLHRPRQWQDP